MTIARNTLLALSAGAMLFGLLALGCSGNADVKSVDPPADGVGDVVEETHRALPPLPVTEIGPVTGLEPVANAAQAQGAPPAPAGGLSLRVAGNHLVDASGAVVRLRGVDRSGQEFKCIQSGSPGSLGWGIFDGPTDLPSAQAIASWHANAVRLPLNEDCWLGINGVNPAYSGAAYQAAVEGYVATLHQAGLYVIVDLHWNAPGDVPAASQQPLPDADHAVDFWTSVATAFAADPAVVLDLYNEPFLYGTYLQDANQDPWACWLDGCGLNQYLTGGTPYTAPLAWNAVGMQPLVNAVRATGARNPIMVGGLDWANDLSGWLAHQPQDPEHAIVAAWHSYPGEGCASEACWTSVVAPVAAVVPVVTGEVGDSVCTAATYVPTLLPWADSQGVSYLGWTWNTWGDCANILISDYTGTPTANYGQAFQSLLAAAPDSGAPPAPAGGLSLRVAGNHLVDASGAVVRLRGVDRSGQEFKCIQSGSPGSLGWGIFDGPTDLPSAQAIASWHANAVRLPLNEDCWLGINGVNPAYSGAAYQAAVEGYVATLHQAGLYVIVDLHWNAPGDVPAASQQPLPDADHAVDFWTSVATAFAADPAVVLDLYNEPFLYGTYLQDANQDPWACWLDGCELNQYLTGGTPYTVPLSWNAIGMQPLVNAVRATGAKNPIMVGGLDWANDLSGWLAHQPQDPEHAIVAAWHSYPGEGCASEACWSSIVAPVAAVVPVVTGEVGDSVCTAATYVPTLLPWADSQGVSYLGWTWNTWGDCANILISDYTGTPTANYGQAFQTWLAASNP